jgi:tetratricopeptide (TPR) repeat protein
MAYRAGIVALVLAVTACAAPGLRPPPVPPEALLSANLSGSTDRTPLVSQQAIFALDDEMRAFVARHARRGLRPRQRLEQLLLGMRNIGLFELDYATDVTLTARETFYERRGNCLSFTILFVALAREAGLDVRFQLVEIPPSWTGDSELVILNNHINALIRTAVEPDYVVDFNVAEYKGNYATRTVSDSYAMALFYSNRGVEAMTDGRDEESLAYFRHSIDAYPDIAGPWVNLGVLYSRRGLAEHAESAYLHALSADARDRSALVNLVKLYGERGDDALADQYRERVRRYQQRNPYYHYSLASSAYKDRRPREAVELIDKAIRLKKDEHQFYYLRSLALYDLGDMDAARRDLARARDFAERGDLRSLYATKIAALGG